MNEQHKHLSALASLSQTGKKIPALKVVRDQPELAAVISKLVKPRVQTPLTMSNGENLTAQSQGQLSQISEGLKTKLTDAETTMQLFPDMELAAQILVSSVLSPKDMVSTEILYKAEDANLPAELISKMLESIRTNLDKHYKFKEELPTIIRQVLFEAGSYIKAVIPESSVDELVNNRKAVIGMESLSELVDEKYQVKSLGVLGPSFVFSKPNEVSNSGNTVIGLESFNRQASQYVNFDFKIGGTFKDRPSTESYGDIEVTDNFNLLKLPKIIETNNKNKLRSRISGIRAATEDVKITRDDMRAMIYKGPQNTSQLFVAIKDRKATKRRSVGRPLVMKFPTEATIPVHVPGNEKEHIGYFVLVDAEGYFVTRNTMESAMHNLVSQPTEAVNMTSALMQRARKNLQAFDKNNITIDQASQIYADLIEADLTDRLKNGLYGSKAEVAKSQEVYRIMMARALANQYTRLVYVPAELVTYFAFKHHRNGVGKSLLDDLSLQTSLRAILLFAKVMAKVKSSINITRVNMTLDPNDPDPQKTVEMSIHEILRMRQQYFPLGINSPNDLVDWIQRAGFQFTFEGHPGLPQTKFDFETQNLQHQIPDDELDEMLRKQSYMALGLNPETVDNGFNSEFATTVVSNNILMSKRVTQIQEVITQHMADYVKKVTLNDYDLRKELLQIIVDNKDSIDKYLTDDERKALSESPKDFYVELMETFVEGMEVTLPRPDITSIDTQMQAFQSYEEALEKTLDSWISSEIVDNGISGDISNNIDAVKAAVKAYYLRKWMSENNFMAELNDIVAADEDGHALLDLYQLTKEHTQGLIRSALNFIRRMNGVKIAADNDLQAMGTEPSDTTSDSGGGEEDAEGADDFGGGDDMFGGGMDDTGGEEETSPTEEEGNTEAEEKPEEEPPI